MDRASTWFPSSHCPAAVTMCISQSPLQKRRLGIARAGDLMSSLPKEMRAENLMCYIGHEGTYTPAHREMCASLGQNIMVEASTGLAEDGKLTQPGSSIWFMTETKEREVVAEYWLSRLGHDIEIEKHFAQVNAWKNAPFKTYVVEQKPGDFILIPPLAPHQVWNRGTRTMKVAWNRTTIETLEMAMHEALPRARMVCRDEQYKNKAIIYYTMQKYSKLLRLAEKFRQKSSGLKHKMPRDSKVRQLEKDFRRLQLLFTGILVSESFLPDRIEKKVEYIPYDSNITCSYCRCNIFNRFLTCPNCVGQLANGDEDTYDICMECYAMGRSCACISKLRWVEQWPWGELTQKHEQWRQQILQYEGRVTEKSPMPLKIELDRLGNKRTLAQICQLELAKRPFCDIRRPPSPVTGDDREVVEEVDANGNVKKKKKIRRTDKFLREHARCHVDFHWEPKWKQATCTKCDKHYCYGTLFRRFDMMPQDILAEPDWLCPSCRNICGCRQCKSRPGYKAYHPSGTILGHNTKAIADPRSVESLVDFSYSNIAWIQKAGDDYGDQSRRLEKRRKEAEAAKATTPELGEHYVDGDQEIHDGVEDGLIRLAQQEGIPIDPMLTTDGPPESLAEDEDDYDENPEGVESTLIDDLTSEYAIPEGGVIRDVEHAYDPTEAITYDYPDPEIVRHVPVLVDEEQVAVPSGYAPGGRDDRAEIEMIERKRKRARLDDGDRPYHSKKANVEKNKVRKSLIVKLPLPAQKLEEMQKMADMARQALNGAEAPAPVISSDLHALNAAEGNPQTVQKKIRRGVENVVVEQDDDFMPGRYRDRRKHAADGAPRPPPDAEITRRQTRMHNTHYEEPSEDEFNEVVSEPSSERRKSMNKPTMKVVRLDDAGPVFDSSVSSDTESAGNESSASSPPVEVGPSASTPAPRMATKAPKLTVVQSVHNITTTSSPADRNGRPVSVASLSPLPQKATLAKSTSAISLSSQSKAAVEAQANRRAKMAAIEWMENESEDLDDVWSQESFLDKRTPGNKAATPAQTEVAPARQKDVVAPPKAVTNSKRQSRGSLAPPTVPKRAVVSTAKALASEWADSDDSDDGTQTRKPGQAWVAVNNGAASASRVMPAKSLNAANGPKKRGRLPKHPW
ncbi:Zinc-finger domain-containing protein isoform 1 [Cladophialophora immunda]|nr:Zinc-finger domain-containing protein isoform 1 [Cladophialophora immunda]